ncbi:BMP family lipoprotein [Halalkalibacter okhensis]|uniref:ABC transporter substrate-binding protein n=1 Tax=Halalkalibacter okhensis TaxID=333138 RepID=A0A0B0IKK4_9BACI|nr:BMP family ABC transporter substrate-binding protein [Halalkalibacter okhensis]KHF40599.1 ABC transporter substrate-binding protein [Halalkalibacter okhensis]
MRNIIYSFVLILIFAIFLSGCNIEESNPIKEKTKIGIMLSDVGLGDQSFSDAAFQGLVRARDELGIVFDYRELKDTETYEQGLMDLVEADHHLIVGLGFMVQEELETVAKQYPNQLFLLVDAVSEVDNIISLTFKEDEGSYLAGVIAALTTETKTIGFIGGDDVPLIQKFANGFAKGAASIDPEIEVLIEYSGDFGNDVLGAEIAKNMIDQDSDVLYSAAGFTGVGALREAQQNGVYAIGVDSDQFYYAEEAIITSMMKNVDVALFDAVKEIQEHNQLSDKHIELGLADNGVGLAPVRIINLTAEQEEELREAEEALLHGDVIFSN